jgi:hypothetical protein
MSDKTIKKSKAELHEMLAAAVRNTQPQPVPNAQPDPVRNTHPAPERDTRPRKDATRTEAHGQNEKHSGIWSQQVAPSIAPGGLASGSSLRRREN